MFVFNLVFNTNISPLLGEVLGSKNVEVVNVESI